MKSLEMPKNELSQQAIFRSGISTGCLFPSLFVQFIPINIWVFCQKSVINILLLCITNIIVIYFTLNMKIGEEKFENLNMIFFS